MFVNRWKRIQNKELISISENDYLNFSDGIACVILVIIDSIRVVLFFIEDYHTNTNTHSLYCYISIIIMFLSN